MTSLTAGPALREWVWEKVIRVSKGITGRGPDPAQLRPEPNRRHPPAPITCLVLFSSGFLNALQMCRCLPPCLVASSFLQTLSMAPVLMLPVSEWCSQEVGVMTTAVWICAGKLSWVPETHGQAEPIRLAWGGGGGGTTWAKAFFCPSRCLSDHPFSSLFFWSMWKVNDVWQWFLTRRDICLG